MRRIRAQQAGCYRVAEGVVQHDEDRAPGGGGEDATTGTFLAGELRGHHGNVVAGELLQRDTADVGVDALHVQAVG